MSGPARKQERTGANEVHPVALLIACWKIKRNPPIDELFLSGICGGRGIIHVAMNFIVTKVSERSNFSSRVHRTNNQRQDMILLSFTLIFFTLMFF